MSRPADRPADPRDPRPFAREAYLFVFRALQEVQDAQAAASPGDRPDRPGRQGAHVTAAELCAGLRELAAAEFGGLAGTVLSQWGLTDTADVGRVVFELVDRGELCKCDGDRPEDFADLFEFDAAFGGMFEDTLARLRTAEPAAEVGPSAAGAVPTGLVSADGS